MVYDWTTSHDYKSGVNNLQSAVYRVAHNPNKLFQVFVIAEVETWKDCRVEGCSQPARRPSKFLLSSKLKLGRVEAALFQTIGFFVRKGTVHFPSFAIPSRLDRIKAPLFDFQFLCARLA